MPSETAFTVISGGGCFKGGLTGIDTPEYYRRRESGCASNGQASKASNTRNSHSGDTSGLTVSSSLYAVTERYNPSRGSRCTIKRRAATSTTQYSTIPARAYNSAL